MCGSDFEKVLVPKTDDNLLQVPQNGDQRCVYRQMAMFTYQVKDPFEVVGDKDEPYIGRCPCLGPFGHQVIETPLPLYGTEGMLHDGLSSFVEFLVPRHPFGILLDIFLELASLDNLSVLFCGGTELTHRTALAGRRFILFEIIVAPFVTATVALQDMPLGASVGIVAFVVREMFGVVRRTRAPVMPFRSPERPPRYRCPVRRLS